MSLMKMILSEQHPVVSRESSRFWTFCSWFLWLFAVCGCLYCVAFTCSGWKWYTFEPLLDWTISWSERIRHERQPAESREEIIAVILVQFSNDLEPDTMSYGQFEETTIWMISKYNLPLFVVKCCDFDCMCFVTKFGEFQGTLCWGDFGGIEVIFQWGNHSQFSMGKCQRHFGRDHGNDPHDIRSHNGHRMMYIKMTDFESFLEGRCYQSHYHTAFPHAAAHCSSSSYTKLSISNVSFDGMFASK